MEEKDSRNNRPDDADWKQQRLKAWQPLLTPPWVIGTFVAVAIIFIPIGIGIVVSSNNVVEYKLRYDEVCGSPNVTNPSSCSVTFTITDKMTAPVYVYYELTNYYQNHRRYVNSRSDYQLAGDLFTGLSTCTPLETAGSKTLVPCGLIANSFFNDTLTGTYCPPSSGCVNLSPSDPSNTAYPSWQKDGIAWASDKADKFKYVNTTGNSAVTTVSAEGVQLPRVDDEDFIVWMRTSGLPSFRKLYRKITDRDIEAGSTLTINIVNRYPVSSFDGSKSVILSTTSWLGGKNSFLGWCYIAVGITCAILAVAFQIKQWVSPRRLGDMQYFHWSATGNKQMEAEDS